MSAWSYFTARSALEWGRHKGHVDRDEYEARVRQIVQLWFGQIARDPSRAGGWNR